MVMIWRGRCVFQEGQLLGRYCSRGPLSRENYHDVPCEDIQGRIWLFWVQVRIMSVAAHGGYDVQNMIKLVQWKSITQTPLQKPAFAWAHCVLNFSGLFHSF
ncbi:hypothetical protein CPC735_037430 [Coccidioides posadasii C735 delta SOWgp]|uniref:Uncharacterized protein n=1 Tax=Coccidioides posadasii (strain C735) TaxID=222929 RepID=C5P2D4_COCP7|nr:hypothetical protein CPC735_037430 [Coccidioides posadasii C735 delta SOWgp]EER29037.1 hypothetical protein CPC735_037430 [Coccidioides posadasii C735 delta SOWgp]|eukprot:XP_003071182.1 hypothetical protein CPC735_037430 [Coccidioides posadasii C735 delta SOWgp]